MKIIVRKENEEIITKFIDSNGDEKEFSNIEMVEYMYNNPSIQIPIEFFGLTDIESQKIKKLFIEIYNLINENQ